MRIDSFILLLTLLLVGLCAPEANSQVQLNSGRVLMAEVQEAHDEGLTIRRLDNGGVLDLRWDNLSPKSALEIKQAFGLSVDDESEVLVNADVIDYAVGGNLTTVVGKIVSEDTEAVHVRRKTIIYPVKRVTIRRRTSREVPVLDIYTKDQFYNEKLTELSPGENADKHILVADLMMRVRQYGRAAEHLKKAKSFGGGSQPNVLEAKLLRVRLFSEAAKERELLDEIGVARARRNFSQGIELIERYEQEYASGKLKSEFEQEKSRFAKARERYLVSRVAEVWYRTIWTLANRKATEGGIAFNQAREYAEAQMGKDIRERVTKVLQTDADETEEMWPKRLAFRGVARSEKYSYGIGSWTLGEDAIKKGSKQGAEEEKETVQKTSEQKNIERMARRIREAVERSRRASSQQRGQEKVFTEDDWWADAKADARALWVRAYYAEFGGDLELVNAYVIDCVTCAGRGDLATIGQTGGKERKVKCPTCQGTRHKRVIRAR